MHVHELLDDEVKAFAGERYARNEESVRGRRHESNPGTVGEELRFQQCWTKWRRRMLSRTSSAASERFPRTSRDGEVVR